MNWLDIILVVVLIASAVGGLFSGLIKSVLNLAGLIVGVVLAGHYYNVLAGALTFVSGGVAKVLGFIIILVVILVLAGIAGTVLTKVASAIALGWVNRLGGTVFGLIMGGIWCGALLAMWVKFIGSADVITHSVFAPLLLSRFPMILALLPDEFDAIQKFFQGSGRQY